MNRIFSKSIWLAILVTVAVSVWMLSGYFQAGKTESAGDGSNARSVLGEETANIAASGTERARIQVAIVRSKAQLVSRDIVVSGRTEPNRSVEIRAEAEGRVVQINAERGAFIAAGQPVARLDVRDRQARLAEAEALVAQHQLQYEAAERLSGQNLMSAAQIAEAKARLVSSEAARVDVRLEIERTNLVAPFDAIVQERAAEIGDFVRIGDTIAELVDIDPLIVVGEISEREISTLTAGHPGAAILGDGRKVEGFVRYVAPVANEGTRTFRVELAVPNPDLSLRAGTTAQLKLATETVRGHLLSPALLALDDSGSIGVKIVDKDSRAHFVRVEMLRSADAGIWVTGLPDEATVIAIGQGFVTDGQLVNAVPADAAELGSE